MSGSTAQENRLRALGLNPFPPRHGAEANGEELPSFTPDQSYQAHARAVPAQLPAIHFIFQDGHICSCQYMHLDSESRFLPAEAAGQVLAFRFMGSLPMDVRIEGRNLRLLYDYVTQHRMAWVCELPAGRDFEEQEAAVIHTIRFQPAGTAG